MTDEARETGPVQTGPAQEQVVIRDKRKIDASGRPRTEAGTASEEVAESVAETQDSSKKSEATMGQPARSDETGEAAQTPAADEQAKEAKAAKASPKVEQVELDKDGNEVVTGDVVGATGPLGAELEALRGELDERLQDLQRVTAEYSNYRKRVDRDRTVVVEQAIGTVVSALLPILDDLDRAREHGDLNGPFAAVAEQLNAALAKFGLSGFGEPGDAFDPTRHDAVSHETSAEVTEPTCTNIMRRGYLLGDRLLRPAMVAVADPA